MARARKVRGIRGNRSLVKNGRLVIDARLDELLSWRQALVEPEQVQELHDMRIAAKRLRYAVEILDVCFPGSKEILKDLRDMQEAMGDIHDLDVLIALLRERLQRVDAAIEQGAIEIMAGEGPMSEKSNRLRALLYGHARDRQRLGLLGLVGDKVAQRAQRYAELQERWGHGGLDDLALRVRAMIQPTDSYGSAPSDGASPAVADKAASMLP